MKDHAAKVDRVLDLAEAICDGDASDNDFIELDSIVHANQPSCHQYLSYCQLHAALRLELRAHRATQEVWKQISVKSTVPFLGESSVASCEMPSAAPFSLLPSTLHGATGYFSGGWPVAYLIATVIFGIGAVIGAFTYVSHPVQVAERLPAVTKGHVASEPQKESVGRITGMVDCRWADSSAETILGSSVPLGRKYSLHSGLMEITYDTGATVILQGPVTYEVESGDGGCLSLGKLTAKLEKKAESTKWKAKESNPQSLILNPLFVVHTPTATVTDLGTEFGVEVNQQGSTAAYVFQGTVQVRGIGRNGPAETVRVLHADETVCVEQDAEGRAVLLNQSKIGPDSFMRTEQFKQLVYRQQQPRASRWRAYVEQMHRDPALVVHYDFQRRQKTPNILHAIAPRSQGSLNGTIETASARGFASQKSTRDNLLSGCPAETSSILFTGPGCAKSHLTDGSPYSHVFADNDTDQRLVVHGFNSPVKLIRIWRGEDRFAQGVTIRGSRSDLTSLKAADYELPLASMPSLVFDSDGCADIRVEAPLGTQSLFFDFGDRTEFYPAGGWDHPAGIRTDEIQAYAAMPDLPVPVRQSEALWSVGRMPGTTALQFNGIDSCVKIHLPQQFTEMTAATWVTVDFINERHKACGLLMSDGMQKQGNEREQCRWQINRTGEIYFGTWRHSVESPIVLPWQQWGRNRWRHLAVTTDPVRRQIVLYLDGKRIYTAELSKSFAAVFGNALIGNWVSDAGNVTRGLCGRMDDLAIFTRAMTSKEIKEMYEAGKP